MTHGMPQATHGNAMKCAKCFYNRAQPWKNLCYSVQLH